MTGAEQPHPLEVVLADRGLSLAGMAELCRAAIAKRGLRSGVDRNLVWKWKTGRTTPSSESQRHLADALGVSPTVVREHSWPEWLWHAVSGPERILRPPWSITGTMQVLKEVAGGPMDRRDFLVITGATLTGLATQWSSAVPAPAVGGASLREPGVGRLTPDALGRLSGRLADLRHLDDELGGRDLHQLAVAEFRWLNRLAGSADYDVATGRKLLELITEAARLCGWCHFDAAHHAAAQSYYVAALRSSASAQDPLAGAHVLACMSFQAALSGRHHDAITLIDSAEERLGRRATPRLNALLASRKARAYARAGETSACGRALNDAERYLDAAECTHDEPDWIYYFDHAELAAQAGACWIDLREPNRARPLIDDALATISPGYVRDRTIYHVRSAETYLHADALEQACAELSTAATLARHTGSVRSIDTIRQARRSMTRHTKESCVRELDDQLTGLVA